ncbi:MAG: hypothetical protein ACRDS9_10305 [Pseudonocardiaceae bacterium]
MRGRDFSFSMEFNGHRIDDSVLMCLSSGQTDQWLIDVPAVLWTLERIAAGDVDARTVQDRLRQATLWDSGCCGECDHAAPYYEEARSRYDAAARHWEHQQEQLDPAAVR